MAGYTTKGRMIQLFVSEGGVRPAVRRVGRECRLLPSAKIRLRCFLAVVGRYAERRCDVAVAVALEYQLGDLRLARREAIPPPECVQVGPEPANGDGSPAVSQWHDLDVQRFAAFRRQKRHDRWPRRWQAWSPCARVDPAESPTIRRRSVPAAA